MLLPLMSPLHVFLFNDPATTEIYTLSLHDALPILLIEDGRIALDERVRLPRPRVHDARFAELERRILDRVLQVPVRSEEHTSELQSRVDLVCRLLLEKKKHDMLWDVMRIMDRVDDV